MNDPLADFPGYLLRRAATTAQAAFARLLRPMDLSPTQASVLMLVAANPGVTQVRLCDALGIQRANMTPMIAGLEARGVIARQRVDGRSQGLVVTTAGQSLTRQVVEIAKAHETKLMGQVSQDHRAAVIPILRALWTAPE